MEYTGYSNGGGPCVVNYGATASPTLPRDAYFYEIPERLVPATFYVDGQLYGYGLFGYTTTSIANYYGILNSYGSMAFINGLTGKKTVNVVYSSTVFNGMTWSWQYPYGYNCGNKHTYDSSTNLYGMMDDSGRYTQTDASYRIYVDQFTTWKNKWEYWKDPVNATQWINVYRNSSDTEIVIKRNGNTIYDQRNTSDLTYYYLAYANDITAHFKNVGSGYWWNYTLEGSTAPVQYQNEQQPTRLSVNP